MNNRRDMLKNLAAGAAAGVAVSASPQLGHASTEEDGCDCCNSDKKRQPGKVFPNATVYTHENRRSLFYNDLIRDKLVYVNFMSIAGDTAYPVTENLVKVQRMLGDRMGRDVFMCSVTVDPEHDTPEELARFAKHHGVGPGWSFVTGDIESIRLVHGAFFIHAHGHHHKQASHGPDCSLGIVRYGNDSVGTWGSVAARSSPEWIAERINWVQPRPRHNGQFKRKGPPRPSA